MRCEGLHLKFCVEGKRVWRLCSAPLRAIELWRWYVLVFPQAGRPKKVLNDLEAISTTFNPPSPTTSSMNGSLQRINGNCSNISFQVCSARACSYLSLWKQFFRARVIWNELHRENFPWSTPFNAHGWSEYYVNVFCVSCTGQMIKSPIN